MGKRELLLIVGFVIAGVVVYQATAPPPDPNQRGLSLSRLLEAARREVRGNPASAVITSSTTHPIGSEVTEVRVIERVHEIDVVGENRADVEATLRVHSNGYNDEEARRYGEQTKLRPDSTATSLAFRVVYPEGRHTGRQRAHLTLKIPSRLRVRVESRPARLAIAGVAGVEATNSAGEASIKRIPGRVTVLHRSGSIAIEDVGTLKFTGRNADIEIRGVGSDTSIVLEQGCDLTASRIGGPLDLESRNADVKLEQLDATRGPIRVNAVNGTVTMKDITSEARIDGRNAELTITMKAPAPMAVYSDGDEVAFTPPPGGFNLDAVVVGGRIAPDEMLKSLGLQLSSDPAAGEARASGAVRGGGPTITIRTTRGDLNVVDLRASPSSPAPEPSRDR